MAESLNVRNSGQEPTLAGGYTVQDPNACGHQTKAEGQQVSRVLEGIFCGRTCLTAALEDAIFFARQEIKTVRTAAVAEDRKKMAEVLRLRAKVAREEANKHLASSDLLTVLSYDVENDNLS